jgi:hypothetical protein
MDETAVEEALIFFAVQVTVPSLVKDIEKTD